MQILEIIVLDLRSSNFTRNKNEEWRKKRGVFSEGDVEVKEYKTENEQ